MSSKENSSEPQNVPAGSIPQNAEANQDNRKVSAAVKPQTRTKATDQNGSKKRTSLPFAHQPGAVGIGPTNNHVLHPVGGGLMVAPGVESGTPEYNGTHLKDQRQRVSSPTPLKSLEVAPAIHKKSRQHHRPDGGHDAVQLPVPGAIRFGGRGISDGLDVLENDLEKHSKEQQHPNISTNNNMEDNITLEAVLVNDEEQINIEEDRQRLEQQIRDEFLKTVVTGEVTAVPPNNKMGKFGILAIILVIGIIGIAVGVALGRSNEDGAVPSTLRPTISPMPSLEPTNSPSAQPSVAPSISIANLDNRNVEEAHPLTLRTAPLVNNLANAADQSFSIDCGPLLAFQGAGLWYIYKARTSGPVHVIVCGGDAIVSAYQGRGEVGSFACIDNKFDNGGDIGNCGGSSVSWEAIIGEQYYVLVRQSFDEPNPITVGDDFAVQIVDNDQCEHAAGPVTPTSVGAVMSYTTINAEADEASTCGGASASTSPGVWYEVEGTGEAIIASTCGDETTFDTQISVFRGRCGSLVCVNGNNDYNGLCTSQSTVVWPSVLNETYYILVHGATNDDKGSFKLTLSKDTLRAENDFCDTALQVAQGDSFTFAFSGSSAEPDLPRCGEDGTVVDAGSGDFPYGIWYSFVGTGLSVGATVSTTTTSPVTMNIYSGSCGSLSCVANVRSESCTGSNLSERCLVTACIQTTQGQLYYVFVSTESLESIDEEHTLDVESC